MTVEDEGEQRKDGSDSGIGASCHVPRLVICLVRGRFVALATALMKYPVMPMCNFSSHKQALPIQLPASDHSY